MSFFSILFIILFHHFISFFHLISSFIVLLIIFVITKFYLRVSRYPKGPFPYFIIGNLTYLSSFTCYNPHHALCQLQLKYGHVFTIWISHKPFVFVTDARLVREAYQKPEFSDRGLKYFGKIFTMDKGQDFAFNEYNHVYADQKKIVLSALRKYALTEEINDATSECVEVFWNEIKKQEVGKSIDVPKYLHLIGTTIIARSLYGAKYTLDDPELLHLKNELSKVPRAVDLMSVLGGLPDALAQFLFNLLIKTSWLGFPEIVSMLRTKVKEHLDSYENGRIRDVVDALIAAKEEAILEDKESAAHLNDVNLTNILTDLFVASVDTITCMCEWIIVLMAKFPDMQSEMRREICLVVGDRLPMQEDKEKCHFTMAFINESMRLHAPGALSLAHQNKFDVEIGGHKLPARTTIIDYLHGIQRNPNYWQRQDQFDPKRMLDADGKLQTNKLPALMPFSVGRRSCPGEKLAQIDGFLIAARMLQLTDNLNLEIVGDAIIDIQPDPSVLIVQQPVRYKLMLKQRLND